MTDGQLAALFVAIVAILIGWIGLMCWIVSGGMDEAQETPDLPWLDDGEGWH